MKHIEDLDDLLDAYLDGNLADLDRKEFEYALANDPALRQRLELFKVERLVGDELILRDIRRKVKVVLPPKPKPMPTWTTTINRPRLSAAAAVLVILMSAVYYWDKRAEPHPSPAIATTDKEAKQVNPPENQLVPQTTAPPAPNEKGEVKKTPVAAPPRPIASTPVEPPPAPDPPIANPETVDAVALVPTTATPETDLQNKVEALESQLNARFRDSGQKTHIDAGQESFRKALSFCQEKKYGEAIPLLEKFLKENPDHYLNSEATALVEMLRRLKQQVVKGY